MNPDDFRTALDDLGWTMRGLAALMGWDDRLVRRWGAGSVPIPPEVGDWLHLMHRAVLVAPNLKHEWFIRPAAPKSTLRLEDLEA